MLNHTLSDQSIFEHMQTAVQAAQTSRHKTSQVGATLVGQNTRHKDNSLWSISKPNTYPPNILKKLGPECRIGNASGTIHAETLCIVSAPQKTANTIMFSTDPSCPNCMKNMVTAGIKHLYIDHKGFEKYYAKKRMIDFENISLEIARMTGVGISKVYRKEKRIEILCVNNDTHYTNSTEKNQSNTHFALCKNKSGKIIESTTYKILDKKPNHETKYSLTVQPLTNLLMLLAYKGIKSEANSFVSSRLPTSRELVNFIGAGYNHLNIKNPDDYRDIESLGAVEALTKNNILTTDIQRTHS